MSRQVARDDDTGIFARFAVRDKIFPRRAKRLHIFLLRFDGIPDKRAAAKRAHAEYRRSRRTPA